MDKNTLLEMVKLLPIYLLFLGTFGQASTEKFLSGGMPDWFKNQFQNTIIAKFPGGLRAQYYLIACLEAMVVLLFLLSFGGQEFLPGHDLFFLKAGLVLALFTFFSLGFGLRVAGDFQGAANLFMYFGVTFLIFTYVEKLAGA